MELLVSLTFKFSKENISVDIVKDSEIIPSGKCYTLLSDTLQEEEGVAEELVHLDDHRDVVLAALGQLP